MPETRGSEASKPGGEAIPSVLLLGLSGRGMGNQGRVLLPSGRRGRNQVRVLRNQGRVLISGIIQSGFRVGL